MDRNGNKMNYWPGGHNFGCACGVTKTCAGGKLSIFKSVTVVLQRADVRTFHRKMPLFDNSLSCLCIKHGHTVCCHNHHSRLANQSPDVYGSTSVSLLS